MSILPMNTQPKKVPVATAWTAAPGKSGSGISTQIQGPKNGGINPGGLYTGGPRKQPVGGASTGAAGGFLAEAIEPQGNRVSQAPNAGVTQAGSLVGSSVNVPSNGGIKYDPASDSGAIPTPKQGGGFIGEAQGEQSPTPPPTGQGVQSAPGSAADQYINKDTDTVEGRLNNLLGQNSDYMKRAETKGLQTAASRGLLNSSMAAGAAQASAIDASLPIAQQDAATYSGFATRSQQYDQQQGLNADQFAQERAIKQWEQDNLAYSQLIKGISDINMQDMSKTAKDQAIKNLWEMYQKARPISSSLADVSIVDGKIVRGSGGSGSGGGDGTNSGGSAGTEAGGGASDSGGGSAGGSASGASTDSTQKSYFDFKSTKEMPQWVRDSYKARYGNIEPPKAQAIQGVIDYAKEKFRKYLSPIKTANVQGRAVQYSPGAYGGVTFSSPDAAKAYKDFITKELKKSGLPVDEKTISTVAAGPDWKAPPSTYMTL